MKQYLGIRFSRYGQVRVGFFEQSGAIAMVLGQGVVAQSDTGTLFGRIVWQSESCHFLKAFDMDESPVHENNVQSVETPSVTNTHKAKEDFFDSIEAAKPQRPFLVRHASKEELVVAESNDALCRDAYVYAKKCIKQHILEMKLVDVEILLDKSKIIFYFTAPTRIDFRELVKDLVREYRTRIELRQIGVRHETQMLGALGNCGMVICCRRYLKEFAPVTIKMAKEQNLFLNPAKISGICSRLLCCLSFEQENYESFHRISPKLGKRYETTKGLLRVLRSNMFRNSIFVLNSEGQEEEINIDDWQVLEPKRVDSPSSNDMPRSGGMPYGDGSVSEEDMAFLEDDNTSSGNKKRKPHKPYRDNSR